MQLPLALSRVHFRFRPLLSQPRDLLVPLVLQCRVLHGRIRKALGQLHRVVRGHQAAACQIEIVEVVVGLQLLERFKSHLVLRFVITETDSLKFVAAAGQLATSSRRPQVIHVVFLWLVILLTDHHG